MRSRGAFAAALQTFSSQVGVAALSLCNALVVARTLGPEGRGEVAFLTAIAFLASNVSTMGVQEANINLAGAEPQYRRALATNSLILSLAFGIAATIAIELLVLAVPAAGGDSNPLLLLAVLANMPLLILSVYLRFLLQGDYHFGITNFAWFLPAVINVGINLPLALAGKLTVASAVATWLVGQAIGTILMARHVMRHSEGFGRPDFALMRRTLGFGAKSHVGRLMLLANYRVDQWILGAIAGATQLGYYSVAVAWAEALFLLPTALAAVQRPDVVRASTAEAVDQTARVFRFSVVLTMGLAVGLIIFAPLLCVVPFGEAFSESTNQLRVLALGAFGVVALKQLGSSLTGRRHPTAASAAIGSAFVCTVALDILLIPSLGGLGAAIASSSAYTLGGIIMAVVFVRALRAPARCLLPRSGDVGEVMQFTRRMLSRRGRAKSEPLAPTAAP